MFKNIFSFKGRIRRTEYCLSYLTYIIYTNVSQYYTDIYASSLLNIINVVILLLLIWILVVQGIKRCHDRDNSGWYQMIPFYVFWMLFANSDDGPNQYGDNPKGKGNYNEMDEIGKQLENE